MTGLDERRRNAERLARASGSVEDVARASALNARVRKLPPHSWEHQRKRLMSILEHYATEHGEHVNWAEDYAPGSGSAAHGVVTADWNDEPLARWSRLMERLPHDERVEMDWEDSTSTCGGCNLMIQTEPDSYFWEPQFIVTDGDIICRGCVEDNIEDFVPNEDTYYGHQKGPRRGETIPDWACEAAQGWCLYSDDGYRYIEPDKYQSEQDWQRTENKRQAARAKRSDGWDARHQSMG